MVTKGWRVLSTIGVDAISVQAQREAILTTVRSVGLAFVGLFLVINVVSFPHSN